MPRRRDQARSAMRSYKQQAAQNVSSLHFSRERAGAFFITVTAREGHTLTEMDRGLLEEVARMAREGPTDEELQRSKNGFEAGAVRSVETLLGKADRLNNYATFHGTANLFKEDLDRYRKVTTQDVRRVAQTYLTRPRVVLSVVPKGHRELAAEATP